MCSHCYYLCWTKAISLEWHDKEAFVNGTANLKQVMHHEYAYNVVAMSHWNFTADYVSALHISTCKTFCFLNRNGSKWCVTYQLLQWKMFLQVNFDYLTCAAWTLGTGKETGQGVPMSIYVNLIFHFLRTFTFPYMTTHLQATIKPVAPTASMLVHLHKF